jgi:hypothetical protein
MKKSAPSIEKHESNWHAFNRREKAITFIAGTVIAGLISAATVGGIIAIKNAVEKDDKQEQIKYERRQEIAKQALNQGVSMPTNGDKVGVPVLHLNDSDKEFIESVTSKSTLNLGIENVGSTIIVGLPTDLTKTNSNADYSLAPIGPSGLPVPVLTGYNPERTGVNYKLTTGYNRNFLDTHDINVHLASSDDLGNTTASLIFEESDGAYWLHLESTEENLQANPALIVTVNFEDK